MQNLDILFKRKLSANKKISVESLIPWILISLMPLVPAILTNIDKKIQNVKLEVNHLTQTYSETN